MFAIDATWGVMPSMSLAAGVRTVGELEIRDWVTLGLPLAAPAS